MRKLMLPSIIVVAAVALSAAFAMSAMGSTGGDLVCGTDDTTTDDNTAACKSPSPLQNDFDGFAPAYHCNNVLYTGGPSAVGSAGGNAFYAVGDADTSQLPNGANDPVADHDCDNDTLDGGADDDGVVDGTSIVVLRGVGYLNEGGENVPGGGCPQPAGRNPGCANGEDGGYVGLLGPNAAQTGGSASFLGGTTGGLDAGGKGHLVS